LDNQTSVSKIQTLITAAGDSRPVFLGSGFKLPKSLVKWNGKEVIVNALESYVVNPHNVTVAINQAENSEYKIEELINGVNPQARTVQVRTGVKGALATALLGLAHLELESPLVIAAGDSIIKNGLYNHLEQFLQKGSSTGTIVFKSSNPRWSYLALDGNGRVRNVQEKKVVGIYATTGVFFFRTVREFMNAAKWVLVNNASINNNYYVSTTLNFMISQGQSLDYVEINRDDYISLSLPSDFQKEVDPNGA
jgi:dTDP-glucose pyrophosphorylase